MLTKKQSEYVRGADHRWNVKTGATRSGKTWLDIAYVIPKRLTEVHGKAGLRVFLGNTKGTLQRNIIEPLQERYGTDRVSSIRSDNTALVFGEKVYCLGADNKKHVDRLRGASIAYCYGDEVATWESEVFEMLKSRLDKPWSRFDGTCNPDGQTHWFKAFLDSGADIFQQHYMLDDNPYLPQKFVEDLKREYAGTVFYDRYVLGMWKSAEGSIYRPWCDGEERFLCEVPREKLAYTCIGVDFGGNGSATAFVLVGFLRGWRGVCVLDEYWQKGITTPALQEAAFVDFCDRCRVKYGTLEVRCDSAEQTLINGFRAACMAARLPMDIRNAKKGAIIDRIRFTVRMMGRGAFFVDPKCVHVREALTTAVYDKKRLNDTRLDDGTTNIDSLDAMEYGFEPYMAQVTTMTGV